MFYNISSVYFFHQHHHCIVFFIHCVSVSVFVLLATFNITYSFLMLGCVQRCVRDKLQWGFIPLTFLPATFSQSQSICNRFSFPFSCYLLGVFSCIYIFSRVFVALNNVSCRENSLS